MLNISHKQTTAELNGAVERLHRRLKDALRACPAVATSSEELAFMLLGLGAQPREDTGLSPAEAVFGAQIVLPNEFFQNDEFSVDAIVKKFSKILHVSASSLPRHNSSTDLPSELPASCSLPPLSGSVGAAWFHPFSCSTTALHSPALRPLLLQHQSRVVGRGGRREPPQGLHGHGRHAWQPASPRQTARFAPRRSCCNQAGFVFRPAGFFTFFSGAATRQSWNRFPTLRGVFCTPGPATPSQMP
jgi:hypothetical protein